MSAAEDARALWRQSDALFDRAAQLRREADALAGAARVFSAMASAISEGRDQELVEIVVEMMSRGRS